MTRTLLDVPAELDGHGPPVAVEAEGRPRRRPSRVVVIGVAAALVAAAGMGAVVASTRSGSSGAAGDAGAAATGSATVTRQDLVSRTEVDGTLGYAGELKALNQLQGTVTAVPKAGTVIERGQSLFSVQNRPVPLLFGALPAWRAFAEGMTDGPDVRQLEENLVALGHASSSNLTVDDTFTAATDRRGQAVAGVAGRGADGGRRVGPSGVPAGRAAGSARCRRRWGRVRRRGRRC